MVKRVRHILGISGGKDSAALAVLMHKRVPEMEYFFCDTHKELPETYEYLGRLEARLGIKITRLNAERGFDYWLKLKDGFLPSPNIRWCTEVLKIEPLEEWIGDDEAISYVGIRADENRTGYISTKPTIKAVYPFKEEGLVKADIFRLLDQSGIGIPAYYKWRVRLHDEHPQLFWQAVAYEEEHRDGRTFTWSQGESLRDLLIRREEILDAHKKLEERERAKQPNRPLAQVLAAALDEEDDELGCLMCHL
jgi:hypothetical protein